MLNTLEIIPIGFAYQSTVIRTGALRGPMFAICRPGVSGKGDLGRQRRSLVLAATYLTGQKLMLLWLVVAGIPGTCRYAYSLYLVVDGLMLGSPCPGASHRARTGNY